MGINEEVGRVKRECVYCHKEKEERYMMYICHGKWKCAKKCQRKKRVRRDGWGKVIGDK